MKNNEIEEAEIVIESLVDEINITLSEEDFPEIIRGKINKLNELSKSIKKAEDTSKKAEDTAKRAKDKAVSALFGKKEAIQELQSAGIDLAEAIQAGIDSQKISFEFNKKLSDISNYLFGLAANNIANNRFVLNNLKNIFKGASEKELSDLAKQELLLVIRQLEKQQDVLAKQEKNDDNISTLRNDIIKQNEKTSEKFNELNFKYTEFLNLINNKNEEIFVRIKDLDSKNKNNEDQLGLLNKKMEVKEKNYEESKDLLKENINNLFDLLEKNSEIMKNQQNELKILKESIVSSNKISKKMKINMLVVVILFVISIVYTRM